ncbi:unnamed protein product [Dicrocoelium dendriticum]|nr:unnamed protein product [Dicrocoelium dendriticum]CAI2737535.1 unnamed protein product [Dicrocoelium dendriticum]
MNVISDKFEQDDLRSLDNDSFLHKLESAVYPGLLNNTSSQESQRAVTFAGIESSSDLIVADSYTQSDFRSLANADLSLGAARSDVHRQRRVEHDRNGAFISLFPPVKHIRFPAPGPPVTGWAHLFSNLKDTTVQSTVVPEEPPQTIDVFHSSKQRDSSSHDDTKLTSVTATIFHPIPYTEPFRWQFGQQDPATTFPSSVLVPRRQSQNGPKTRQMSGPSSVGAKELPHINEHSSPSASKPTLASIVKSLQTRPLSPTTFDAHVDSGYHDSILETSLNLSAQSLNSSLPPVNTLLSQPRFSDVVISQGYLLTPSHPLEGVCATPIQTVDSTYVQDFSNLEDTDYMAQDNLDLGTSCSSNGTGQDSGDSATVMLPNHLDINGRSSSKYLRPGFPLRSSNSSPTIGFSKL